jgi:hypothetical protein
VKGSVNEHYSVRHPTYCIFCSDNETDFENHDRCMMQVLNAMMRYVKDVNPQLFSKN